MTPNEYMERAIVTTYKTPAEAIAQMGITGTPAGTLISMLMTKNAAPYESNTEKDSAWNAFYAQVSRFATSPAGVSKWSGPSASAFMSFARLYAAHQSRTASGGTVPTAKGTTNTRGGSSGSPSASVKVPEYQRPPVEVSEPVMPEESGFRFGPLAVLLAVGVGVWLLKRKK